MCEVRKKNPRVNAITVIDSANVPVVSLEGHVVIQLSQGLGFDYDPKSGVAYIGVNTTWLDQEVKRIIAEQGFNIQP